MAQSLLISVPLPRIPSRRRAWAFTPPRPRPKLRGGLFAAGLLLAAGVLNVVVGANFHTVARHRCYRCGQPTAAGLERVARTLGVHTVINLRGPNEGESWYREEREAARRAGVGLVDVGFSAYVPPSPAELWALVRALDESPGPLLLHCHSGGDRSGLAAALYLLLKTDAPLEDASGQLSWRFGHNPWGRAGCHDRLLARYAAWLACEEVGHRPAHLRRWAAEVYAPE